jgi:PAN domain
MRLAPLAFAIAFSIPAPAKSETLYSSFIHDDRIPNTLFLTGEIKLGDSFELRKALRNHDVNIVVMGSAGGNLYEGLQMGSILRDKGISTYVPPGVNCESSCANMFFGGTNRKADGELGVHQFYSNNGERDAPLGVAEASTQYTVANLIGIMNELTTPPFVYEKMLGTTEMHYFTEEEKRKIDLNPSDPEFVKLQADSKIFILNNPQIIERPSPTAAVPVTDALAPVSPTPSSPEAPTTVAPNRNASKRFDNTDFFGADLRPTGHRNISLIQCEQICESNPSCAAWSYVHATRWCWPKSGVSNLSFGDGITSGVVDFNRVDSEIFDRPFLEITATDFSGNDILPRGMPNTTLDECRNACESASSCRAFTWVGKKNICFPKYAIGKVSKVMGAISGLKR